MRERLLVPMLLVPALLWGLAAGPAEGVGPYTVAVLPDTQFYCHTPEWNDTFYAQTQWAADNIAAESIVFASHEGDLVELGFNEAEWLVADMAMGTLDASGLPYAAVQGNHDFGGPGDGYYVQYFGPGRYAGRPWYGGASADGVSHWQAFTGGDGRAFLHLALEFLPLADTRAWAQGVIDAHPGVPTVITTHAYLDADGSYDGIGQVVFDELVYPNSQVFMVLCGHHSGEARHTATNAAGREVFELLADYQSRDNGGDGWMRLVTFEPDEGQVEVYTYSPTLDEYESDADSRFTLSVDFNDRFGPAPDAGDFDGSGVVDADDIDALADLIRLAMPYHAFYDLTGPGENGLADGVVDANDLDYLVHQLVETAVGLGSEYGDFNLDGLVDTTDLTRLATNFSAGSTWGEGNANGYLDLMIDNTDLTILATYYGFGVSADVIPEPATLGLLALAGAALLRRRKK